MIDEPYKAPYAHYTDIDSLIADNSERHNHRIYSYIVAESSVITGNQTYYGDLFISTSLLIIDGDIEIKGKLQLLDAELLIRNGSLKVGDLSFYHENDSYISLRVHTAGRLYVTGLLHDDWDMSFSNDGYAEINRSNLRKYTCNYESVTKITRQEPWAHCDINLYSYSNFTLAGASDLRIVVNKYSREVTYSVPPGNNFSEYPQNYDNYTLLKAAQPADSVSPWLIAAIVFAVVITSAVLTAAVVQRRRRLSDAKNRLDISVFSFSLLLLAHGLLNLATLYTLRPYIDRIFYTRLVSCAVADGRHLSFNADADEYYFSYLGEYMLTLITLGIFSFWRIPRYYNFVASGISFQNTQSGKSYFTGKAGDVFGVYLRMFLRMLALAIAAVFVSEVIFPILRLAGLQVVAMVFLFALLLLFVMIIFWIINDILDFILLNTVISDHTIAYTPVSMRQYLKIMLLSIISLGGYLFVVDFQIASQLLKELRFVPLYIPAKLPARNSSPSQ